MTAAAVAFSARRSDEGTQLVRGTGRSDETGRENGPRAVVDLRLPAVAVASPRRLSGDARTLRQELHENR